MVRVEHSSQMSLQHLGFCHYPYIMCRILSETLANKGKSFSEAGECSWGVSIPRLPAHHHFSTSTLTQPLTHFLAGSFSPVGIYTWAARKDITLPFQSKPCNHWYFNPILWSFVQASRGLIGRLWNLSIFTSWPTPHSLFCSGTGLREVSQHTWLVPPATPLPGEFFPRECQMAWSFF